MKYVCSQLKEISMTRKFLVMIIFLSLSSVLYAHQFQEKHININHPHIKFTIPSGPAAGYMKIVNMGYEIDRLVGIEVTFADAELHFTEVKDGIAKITKVDNIELPAQKAKTLKPGNHHIMFSNFKIDLIEGMNLEGILIFEFAGQISVLFEVEKQNSNLDFTEH